MSNVRVVGCREKRLFIPHEAETRTCETFPLSSLRRGILHVIQPAEASASGLWKENVLCAEKFDVLAIHAMEGTQTMR